MTSGLLVHGLPPGLVIIDMTPPLDRLRLALAAEHEAVDAALPLLAISPETHLTRPIDIQTALSKKSGR